MAIGLFLAALLALSALLFFRWRSLTLPLAWIALGTGLSVFAIRLIQPGTYAMPSGGNLLAALLALGLAAFLFILKGRTTAGPSLSNWAQRILLAASPIVLFLALYSTLAELEEVVVLHTTHAAGHPVDLRLWIVDDQKAGWIQMPRTKADAHGLDQIALDMTRQGQRTCVDVQRFADLENIRRVQRLRYEKYFVQRLATSIGVFPREPTGNAVVLRVLNCPN